MPPQVTSSARQRFFLRAIVRGLAMVAAGLSLRAAANEPAPSLLRTVAEVRAVGTWDPRQPRPLRLEGVLTWVDNERQLVVLQDETGALALNHGSGPVSIAPGRRIVIEAANSLPHHDTIPRFPFQPSGHELLSATETPTSLGLNYVSRLRGYLYPPQTGEYQFWITSDDTSELWLGTDDTPQSARRVAAAVSWTGPGEWNRQPSQRSGGLRLEAGRRYYFEAVHHQRGGNDHFGVSWAGPGMTQRIIDGAHFSPWMLPTSGADRVGSGQASQPLRGRILREYWRDLPVENAAVLTAPRQLATTLSLAGASLRETGPGVFPSPRTIPPGVGCAAGDDFQWCEMEGNVEFVSRRGDALVLELADGLPRTRVVLRNWAGGSPQRFNGRRVRLLGVPESVLNEAGERVIGTLWVPDTIAPVILGDWPLSDRHRAVIIAELGAADVSPFHNHPVRLRGRVVRSEDDGTLTLSDPGAFYGYTSSDGKTWQAIGGPVEVPMGDSVQVGLVVNSRSAESSATAVFDQVRGLSDEARGTSVGGPQQAGGFNRRGTRYTITGSGHDVWISPDQFYFVHHALTGEGEIVAHLAEWAPAIGWAKAGLMMRESLAPDAQFIDLVQSGNMGRCLQWRKQAEGSAPLSVDEPGQHAPVWLKLARRYNTIQVAEVTGTRFAPGTQLEVAGYLVEEGGRHLIRDASCRVVSAEAAAPVPGTVTRPLVELARTRRTAGQAELYDLLKVRGVVTFAGTVRGRHYVVVQDGSAAAIISEGTVDKVTQVRAGQFVEVQSDPGRTAPSPDLPASDIWVLGQAHPPKPLRHPTEYVLPHRGEASWIEVEGVVRAVTPDGHLELKDNADFFTVAVEGANTESLRAQMDATLRVRGAIVYPTKDERLLLVPSTEHIEVIEPAPPQPFTQPVQAVGEMVRAVQLKASGHRAKARGVVILRERSHAYVQDETGGVRVELDQPMTSVVGDLVEVIGFPDLAPDNSLILAHAVARPAGQAAVAPVPEEVTVEQILTGAAGSRLIRLRTGFSRVRSTDTGHTLELQLDQRIFRASLSAPDLPSIPPGSTVEVTGVCVLETDLPEWIKVSAGTASILPMHLLLRSPGDIVVLQKPRWWAVKRTLFFSAAVTAVLLISGFWIQTLRRRVAQRTRELRATMEKLQHETQAAATFAERNRLAGEIHDSLEQGFSGVIFQLDTTAKHAAATPELKAGLTLARNMLAFSRNEVRHAVWDLQSPVLENSDLGTALRRIVAELTPDSVQTTVAVEGEVRRISPAVEHHLLRIAQEAIANCAKHAAAGHLDLVLAFSAEGLRLGLRDDGRGFDPEQVLAGGLGHFGLRSLRGRARKVQGRLSITSAPGRGTLVEVQVPATVAYLSSP